MKRREPIKNYKHDNNLKDKVEDLVLKNSLQVARHEICRPGKRKKKKNTSPPSSDINRNVHLDACQSGRWGEKKVTMSYPGHSARCKIKKGGRIIMQGQLNVLMHFKAFLGSSKRCFTPFGVVNESTAG